MKRFFTNNPMKSRLFLSFLPLFALLSGCTWDEGWKDYNTPELFLSHAQVHPYVTVTSSEIPDAKVQDYDLLIQKAMLECEYTASSKVTPTTEHHFSYNILLSLSTAGPNHTEMHVYADGAVRIDYKSALGSPHAFYYSMAPSSAAGLNAFVERRIQENALIEEQELDSAALA